MSNYKLLKDQFKKLKYDIKLVKINDFSNNNASELKIWDIDLFYKNPFKVSKKSVKKFISLSLNLAHKFGLKKSVAGIINCPINKKLLGNGKNGVTEYLAKKCLIKDNSEVMVIRNKHLMVSPITTHVSIKSISNKITKSVIIKKIKIINKWFIENFKKKPSIAILGLNPHNAELRKDSEEKKIIIPAIKKLKSSGIRIKGPLVADTIFINEYKNFDFIVGMYHDQVLAPFKSLYKFNAINLTLGLKYVRVSPDHGVANDKIMKKISSPSSLLECINYINKLSS